MHPSTSCAGNTPPPFQNVPNLSTVSRCSHMYYYTPLPLNLANKQASNKQATSNKQQATSNKQQATSKQALLLSVLAIAPFHRFGLYSTLAMLYPRWCPCQIQILSQKLTGGAPGRGRQVRRCPPKTAHFVPQNSPFLAQNSPKTRSKWPNKGKRLLHFTSLTPQHVRRTTQKWLKMARIARSLCQTAPKRRTGRILGYVARIRIPRAPVPPATPHFLWFPSLGTAQRDA